MYKNLILALVLVLTHFSGHAQLRAFERSALKNLNKARWAKTHSHLIKGLSKDSASIALRFISAQYFFSLKNPAFDIDSANHYVFKARAAFRRAEVKEQIRLSKAGMDSTALKLFSKKVDSVAFVRAKQLNTEGAFIHFLNAYPQSSHVSEAVTLRDEAAFRDARSINTYQSFLGFLSKYPSSKRAGEARNTYERLLYEFETRDRTLKSYESFIERYPASPFRRQVEKEIFEISTVGGEPEDYKIFLRRYPFTRNATIARNLLFHLLKEADSLLNRQFLNDSLNNVLRLDSGVLTPILKGGRFFLMTGKGELLSQASDVLTDDYQCGAITDDVLLMAGKLFSRSGTILFEDSVAAVQDIGSGFLKITTSKCTRVIHKSGIRLDECVEDGKVTGRRFLALKRNNVWALFSLAGKALTLFEWDDIQAFGNVLIFKRGPKYKLTRVSALLASIQGSVLKNNDLFDDVQVWSSDRLWAKSGDFEGLLDPDMNAVTVFERQHLSPAFFGALAQTSNGYILYDKAGKNMGFTKEIDVHEPWIVTRIDKSLRIFNPNTLTYVEDTYDSVSFEGPFAIAYRSDSVHLFFDAFTHLTFNRTAKFTFLPGRDSLVFLQVQQDKKSMVFNHRGTRLFTFDYDAIEYAGDGFFVVTKRGRKGLMRADGKLVLPPEYDAIGSVSSGMITFLKSMKFGALSTRSPKVIKPQFEKNVVRYSDQLIVAFQKGYLGFINWDSKPQSKFEFDEVRHWTDSVALVKRKTDWYLYDIFEKKDIESSIKQITCFIDRPDEKCCVVKQGDQFGVLHSQRGFIIPPSFSYVVNVGSADEPIYFTEKHVEEALLFVVIYYDQNGKLLHRQVYEEEDYEKILCSDN